MKAASQPQMLKAPFQNVIAGVILENKARLQELVDLVACGKFKAVVGKEFSFTDIQKAHLEVESRHKLGNIVVSMITIFINIPPVNLLLETLFIIRAIT